MTGKTKPDFECFAFKILLGRLGLPVTNPQKVQASITGPITFGEVAYQLLNQTMVFLQILDV